MVVNPRPRREDWEATLRPRSWEEYIGQEKIKENLRISIEAAKRRTAPLEHILFYGSSGLGKTSLAHIIAGTMGSAIRVCSGPSVEKAGDVASLLTSLSDYDILFLDEAHRVPKPVMESLYSAMEDYRLHLVMGRGPMARTMDLQLPRFTLIGATTRLALLPSPFRNRFGHVFQFTFYGQEELEEILRRSAALLEVHAEHGALSKIAERSRRTPRIANRILKRIRDFALIEGDGKITEELAERALVFLDIDGLGLEPGDRRVLELVISKFQGGPVGLQALAATLGEDGETVLEIAEPYLLQLGLLERTPKGRVATQQAYEHLGLARQRSL